MRFRRSFLPPRVYKQRLPTWREDSQTSQATKKILRQTELLRPSSLDRAEIDPCSPSKEGCHVGLCVWVTSSPRMALLLFYMQGVRDWTQDLTHARQLSKRLTIELYSQLSKEPSGLGNQVSIDSSVWPGVANTRLAKKTWIPPASASRVMDGSYISKDTQNFSSLLHTGKGKPDDPS